MSYTTLDELKAFINGVGFPIVVCLILFYFNMQIAEKQNEVLANMNKAILDNSKEIIISRQTDVENAKLLAMLVAEYRKECRP
nr:hypothetical protein 4 [Halomonadaceae bacterium]